MVHVEKGVCLGLPPVWLLQSTNICTSLPISVMAWVLYWAQLVSTALGMPALLRASSLALAQLGASLIHDLPAMCVLCPSPTVFVVSGV